jgi:CheY-like chemotaxis protein
LVYGGLELAARAANRNIPSLLCTGHPDALAQLQEHDYPHLAKPFRGIHVLFTDIHMPGAMDGLALAHHTAKNWPKIALLITSAHPNLHRSSLPEKSWPSGDLLGQS